MFEKGEERMRENPHQNEPWLIDGPIATPGWRASDEERSAAKRRGRPVNHTPECYERQADFRARFREMKMLSDDDVSPVSDPSIGTAPLLSGSSVIAEPSSSSSDVISQPMAVDLDSSESRGLKRGLEGGDMEIAEVCSFISDVNVNEELHPSAPEVGVHRWGRMASIECWSWHVWMNFRRRKTSPKVKPLDLCWLSRGYAQWKMECRITDSVCVLFVDNLNVPRSLFSVWLLGHISTKWCLFWLHITVGAWDFLTSAELSYTDPSKNLCLRCHLLIVPVRFLTVSGKWPKLCTAWRKLRLISTNTLVLWLRICVTNLDLWVWWDWRLNQLHSGRSFSGVMMRKHMHDGVFGWSRWCAGWNSGCDERTSPLEDEQSRAGVRDEISWEAIDQDRAGISRVAPWKTVRQSVGQCQFAKLRCSELSWSAIRDASSQWGTEAESCWAQALPNHCGKSWCFSQRSALTFNTVSKNVLVVSRILLLETCRGQNAFVDNSWVHGIGQWVWNPGKMWTLRKCLSTAIGRLDKVDRRSASARKCTVWRLYDPQLQSNPGITSVVVGWGRRICPLKRCMRGTFHLCCCERVEYRSEASALRSDSTATLSQQTK